MVAPHNMRTLAMMAPYDAHGLVTNGSSYEVPSESKKGLNGTHFTAEAKATPNGVPYSVDASHGS